MKIVLIHNKYGIFLVCNLANYLFIFKVKIQSNWTLGNPEESLPPSIQKRIYAREPKLWNKQRWHVICHKAMILIKI